MTTPLIEFLDWPEIPEYLIPEVYASLKNPNLVAIPEPDATIHQATKPLEDFVKQFVPDHWKVNVQTFTADSPRHRDDRRIITHNFLIELGGDNVTTNFYDPDNWSNDRIQSYHLPLQKWHRLQAWTPHSVDDVTPGLRRMSVCTFEFVPRIPEAIK